MPLNLILIVASGAGAALLTTLVIRDVRAKKVSSAIVFAALFVAIGTLGHILLQPKFLHPEQAKTADEFLGRVKLFSLVAEDNSGFRSDFIEKAVDELEKTKSRSEAFDHVEEWGKKHVAPYFIKYIPHASDQAIYNFSVYFGDVLKEINKRNDQACVTWMYGLSSKDPKTGQAIREATDAVGDDRMFSVMTDVVETAMKSPVDIKRTEKDTLVMRDFVQKLSSKYGKRFTTGLAMSAKPSNRDNNRADMCFAAEKLYTEVVRLPEPDRKIVLRHMFASSS
ncbi:MAG: hypothetical protein R3188_01330 [Acidiferrobacterales bacterium]|nr:hypothetical protein [Acidiferrobacterales bacterium]